MRMESSGLNPDKRKKKGSLSQKVFRVLLASNVFLGGFVAGELTNEPIKKVVVEKKMEYRITNAAKNFKPTDLEKNFKMATKFENLPVSENIQDIRGEKPPAETLTNYEDAPGDVAGTHGRNDGGSYDTQYNPQ